MWCVSNIHLNRIFIRINFLFSIELRLGSWKHCTEYSLSLVISLSLYLSLSLLFFSLWFFETGRKNFRLIVHESGANFLRRFLDKNLRRIHVLIKRLPLSNRAGVSLDLFKINGMSKLFQESSSFKEESGWLFSTGVSRVS